MIDFKQNPVAIFTPGDKPERFNKAKESGANAIILDLEDAVAADNKVYARQQIVEYLSKPNEGILRLVRINHLATLFAFQDILSLSQANLYLDGIVHPKTESPQEINIISNALSQHYPQLPILALIESPLGVDQLSAIVKESKHIGGLIFGAADYSLDVGCEESIDALISVRQLMIQAASIKSIACYDSPYFDFRNTNGLLDETKKIKTYGFTGKTAIHPSQISPITQVFKPSQDDYMRSKQVINIYHEAHGGACQYEGQMIDIPVYKKAMHTVAVFENLSAR